MIFLTIDAICNYIFLFKGRLPAHAKSLNISPALFCECISQDSEKFPCSSEKNQVATIL